MKTRNVSFFRKEDVVIRGSINIELLFLYIGACESAKACYDKHTITHGKTVRRYFYCRKTIEGNIDVSRSFFVSHSYRKGTGWSLSLRWASDSTRVSTK